MRTLSDFSPRTRWAVPAGAVAVVAAVVTASALTVAQAAPALPSRTPAQLLAELAGHRSLPPPLTGTVVETASFGLPQLPGAANPSSIPSMLAGSHTVKIWYADPAHIRLAVPVRMGETDFIRNGNTAWLWQSGTNSATKFTLPSHGGFPGGSGGAPRVPPISLTPQQAAQKILALLGPTTRVSTESNVTVAGQAAYQLVLAPRDSRSLVGKVTIAVDGQHPNVPLRVQVFARGASSPAFQVGYTSISFVRPAPANFRFTPPPGATVHNGSLFGPEMMGLPPYGPPLRCSFTVRAGQRLPAPPKERVRRAIVSGPACQGFPAPGAPVRCEVLRPSAPSGSAQAGTREPVQCEVRPGPGARVTLPAYPRSGHVVLPGPGCARDLPPGVIKRLPVNWRGVPAPVNSRGVPVPVTAPKQIVVGPGSRGPLVHCGIGPMMGPRVVGKGWVSVLILPAPTLPGFMSTGGMTGVAGRAAQSLAGRGMGPGIGPIVGALLQSAQPVHGAWGSGKLIRTSLFSILLTNNGRVLIGAVEPQVLYAAAGHVK
jgi:hypothetical protein